jgi:hypothetical protein
MDSALKGTVPTSIIYKHTPALHISLLNPEYTFPANISGAIYAGVPHFSTIFSFAEISWRDTPKSQILI